MSCHTHLNSIFWMVHKVTLFLLHNFILCKISVFFFLFLLAAHCCFSWNSALFICSWISFDIVLKVLHFIYLILYSIFRVYCYLFAVPCSCSWCKHNYTVNNNWKHPKINKPRRKCVCVKLYYNMSFSIASIIGDYKVLFFFCVYFMITATFGTM